MYLVAIRDKLRKHDHKYLDEGWVKRNATKPIKTSNRDRERHFAELNSRLQRLGPSIRVCLLNAAATVAEFGQQLQLQDLPVEEYHRFRREAGNITKSRDAGARPVQNKAYKNRKEKENKLEAVAEKRARKRGWQQQTSAPMSTNDHTTNTPDQNSKGSKKHTHALRSL